MNRTVRVEMTLSADITLTDEIVAGMIDQYPKTYANADDETLARGILFASVNPGLTESNSYSDDWWDGVGNMRGLINNLELSDEGW